MKLVRFGGVVAISAALIALPFSGANATTDINLLRTGTVSNSDGRMGLVGYAFDGGDWSYTAMDPDTTATADDTICGDSWDVRQLLCDPSPTTDARGSLTQASEDTGYTSSIDSSASTAFIIVDLGDVATFHSLEVYQMHGSDGQVTDAELLVSSNQTDTWPTQADGSWTSVASGPVAEGSVQTGTGPYTNTAVTEYNFDNTVGRYVMFYFENDGSYTQDGYIEVAGAKLFGTFGAADSSSETDTSTELALADTGIDSGLVTAGLGLGVAGLLTVVGVRTVRRFSARKN
jgi:hypothetical protein